MRRFVVLVILVMAACQSAPSDSYSEARKRLLEPVPLATLESAWRWPPQAGTARDLQADDSECRREASQWQQPKKILVTYGQCMSKRGWSRKPIQSAAHSAGSR